MTRSIGRSVGADWANILMGGWVIASPFALGFAHNLAVRWNNVAVGLAVVLLTFAASSMRAIRGVIVLLGGWLLVSPFFLGFSKTIVSWNNIALGILIIIGTILAESMRPIYKAQSSEFRVQS